MKIGTKFMAVALIALAIAGSSGVQAKPTRSAALIPQLRQDHGVTQLFVDGKPFLVLGSELNNSSASSTTYMTDVWPKLAAMNINTILVPAYWELIEPQEGKFDFRSVDGLIENARKHNMRVVLLWFGSWKNSMSSYVPAWVKRDDARFPRAKVSNGTSLEMLTANSDGNLQADTKAFVALMKHIKATDSTHHTVIMVQPENEVGMVQEAREHSKLANAAFAAPVPAALTDYLAKHKDSLQLALHDAWAANGYKSGANWEETFGSGDATDELFNAWTQALYTGKVAAAGKAVYPLPMYANAALIRPNFKPGQYISGGPLPHLIDVWRAAAPALDMLSPDLYFPNFVEWASKYALAGNPLFIPETGRVNAAEMSANGYWAYAKLNAMGFSPYAPEHLSAEDQKVLTESFAILKQLSPQILAAQGTGRLTGIRAPTSFDGTKDLLPQKVTFGRYTFDVHFKAPPPISIGQRDEVELPGAHGGLVIQTGPDEFLVAGTGMYVYFTAPDGQAGIETVEEGHFEKGAWVRGRVLNGDETNQGRHLFVPVGTFTIHRLRLYTYR